MNNLEKLTVKQRAEVVDRFFRINRSTITVAKYKDGTKYYGFFESQDDHDMLEKENKFRLVTANNAIAYRSEKDREIRKRFTEIIDCNKLVDLRMIHAHLPGEIEVNIPGLNEFLSGKTKMTYKEHLDWLHKDSVDKMGLYIKAENELSKVSGFFDKSLFDKSVAAKKEWQEAHNRYLNLLSYIKSNNIDPNKIL